MNLVKWELKLIAYVIKALYNRADQMDPATLHLPLAMATDSSSQETVAVVFLAEASLVVGQEFCKKLTDYSTALIKRLHDNHLSAKVYTTNFRPSVRRSYLLMSSSLYSSRSHSCHMALQTPPRHPFCASVSSQTAQYSLRR